MSESNKWIISTALAVIAIVIPIALYVTSLPKHNLTYTVVSMSELIGLTESIKDLEIKIKGESVESASIYSLLIANNGSEPIMKSDFEKPLLITFKSKVFSVKVNNKIPKNLSIQHKVVGNSIEIAPFLFNQGEEFGLEVLSSSDIYPTVDSRIAGITDVEQVLPTDNSKLKNGIVFVLCFVLLVYYTKSAKNALVKEGFLSKPFVRVGNVILSLTCGFASALLMKSVIDMDEYKIIIYLVICIPAALGMYLARIENKYNKSMQPTANAPAD